MSKVVTYTMIAAGLMLLLNLAGINTTTGYILQNFNDLGNIVNSNLYAAIVAIFALTGTVGTIIIGSFTRTSPESYLVAPVAAILILFTGDFVTIINYASSNFPGWIAHIVNLFFLGFVIAYWLVVISWWRGSDG